MCCDIITSLWTPLSPWTRLLQLSVWYLNFFLFCHYCYYPPAMKLQQCNLFTPVCLSFCSEGGLPYHPHGQAPPGQTPSSWAGTPWTGTHPWADNPSGQTPPAQFMLKYCQQVDSMHPTGMQSCISIN